MKRALLISVVLACTIHPASAESFRGAGCLLPKLGFLMSTVSSFTAMPSAIYFTAANPDGGPVSGSSTATLSWSVAGGSTLQNWTVSVQATASSFTGCSTVPVSAVNVSCATAAVNGGGGTGSCGGSFSLSTVAQQVAGGAEGDGLQDYTVQVNYSLADSWRYVANPSCSLTVTYTVNAL